jgi:chromosomal replication initiation ATPase DnaA
MSGGAIIDEAEGDDEHRLFHAWNAAQTERRPLLMVGRTPPASWTVALPDLRSRLAAAPHVAIAEPDEALARALIERAFDRAGAGYAADLPDWLLRRVERSYGAIDTVTQLLDRISLSSGRKISVAMAKEALQSAGFLPIVPPDPPPLQRE